MAWQNGRHFPTLPLVSPRNEGWRRSSEIPYWWRTTIKIWTLTRHQYGISVVDPQTSFRGKPVVGSGNISCFLTPQNLGGGREKLLLAIKIIVAGLKSRELHEENVVSSLQPVITIIQRKDIRCCILINMFLRRENIKRINIFFSIFYTHFKGPVLKFSLSRTQIFHGQSEIWIQD